MMNERDILSDICS